MDQVWQAVFLLFVIASLLVITRAVQVGSRRDYGRWGNPYAWYAPLWIVQCIILLLPLYDFGYPTSWKTIGFIALCHSALCLGIILAMVFGRAGSKHAPVLDERPPKYFKLAITIGCLAQILFSLDTLLASGVQFSDRFDATGMASAREDASDFSSAFLGPLLGFIIPLTTLIVICIPMYSFSSGLRLGWTRRMKSVQVLTYLGLSLIVFDALFIRIGRFPVLLVLMTMLVARSLGYETASRVPRSRIVAAFLKPVRMIIIVILIGMGTLGATWMQQMRANGLSPDEQIHSAFEVTLKPEVRYGVASSDFTTFYFLQILYLAHSFNVLSVYVDTPNDQLPPPFMGRYNFAQVYKIIGRTSPGFDPEFWQKDRGDLFAVIEKRNRLGNTWGTQLRDFAADFSYPGTVVFMFFLGIFSQAVTDRFYREKGYVDVSLLSLVRVFFLFSAFHSLLFTGIIGWPIVICSTIWMVRPLLFRRIAEKGQLDLSAKNAAKIEGEIDADRQV